MTSWSIHTLFTALKGYGSTKTSLTVHVVYDAFSDSTLVNLKWMDGYKSLPSCLEGCIEFDSFRCGSLLSQGLLIRIFYKSSLIFFSRVKEEFLKSF